MAAAANCSRWSASRRSASTPAEIRGCRVLTRPSSISGKPVTSATSVTSRPSERNARAVPPVETSSKPIPASARANGTRPLLSETDSSARRGVGISAAFAASKATRVPFRPRASASMSETTRGSSRCSTACTRVSSDSSESSAAMETASCATIGPASRVSSTTWIVTPVTSAPAANASRTACKPGYAGRRLG